MRVGEKSAEAIVVRISGESLKERRAEGVSTKLKEDSQRKRARILELSGRDNCGRYPGGDARSTVQPGSLEGRILSGVCGEEPERK